MRKCVVWLAVALVIALLVTGCGDDDEASPTNSTTGSSASATTPAATTDIDPLTGLPRSFPDDFPVMDGTSVTRASEYTDRYVIEWRSDGSFDNAKSFYESALGSSPWQIESTSTDEAATVFDFSGGSSRRFTGSLAVAKLSEGARILLELHPMGAT